MYRKILNYGCCFTTGIKHHAVVAAVLLLRGAIPVAAQDNPWFFGLHTHSNHGIVNNFMAIGSFFANMGISHATNGAEPDCELNVWNTHVVQFEDNGEPVSFERGNPLRSYGGYGVRAYDLWNDIEVGVKGGWLGRQSPIGVYAYAAYAHNRYKLRFLGEQWYSRHKLHNFRVGIGTRISPLRFLREEYDWCPIIELGTTYVKNFSYKGPYGNDIGQINDGMRTSFAIGAQFGEDDGETYSIMLCLDMAQYDIFNRNYTPDGGFWFPYANVRSKDMNFSLRISFNLFED